MSLKTIFRAKTCMVFGLLVVGSLPPINPQINFYTGNLSIDSAHVMVDIGNHAAVIAEYVLTNTGGEELSSLLTCVPQGARIVSDDKEIHNTMLLAAGERKEIRIMYNKSVVGEHLKYLSVNPLLLINERYPAKRIAAYAITVKLPENVRELLGSNREHNASKSEDHRVLYVWNYTAVYPIQLNVKWSALPDIDFEVAKTAESEKAIYDAPVRVTILIRNNGLEEVENITLVDSFEAILYDSHEPDEEFEYAEDGFGFQWIKRIDRLGPREIQEHDYSVMVENENGLGLESTTVLVNDYIVGFSNSVLMEEDSTRPRTNPPFEPLCVEPSHGMGNVSLTPTLVSTPFVDPDPGDRHNASEWEVTTIPGDYTSPIYGSGMDPANLVNITLPSRILGPSTTYFWRVRYQDSRGIWSKWSDEFTFNTKEEEEEGEEGPLVSWILLVVIVLVVSCLIVIGIILQRRIAREQCL